MDGAGKSQAFADALARARQLAAKLGAGSGGSNASPSPAAPASGFKRGFDDFSSGEPDAKRPAAMADPFGAQLAALKGVGGLGPGPLTASGLGIKTGIAVSGSGKSCQEEIRIPDPLVGLIIGRGGEQINRIQTEASCKVQLAPDNGTGQDRPCYLQGTKEAIERAKEMVMEIISSKSHEIGNITRNFVKTPTAGVSQGQVTTIEMMIPGQKVGLIIGKGGETIRTLQDKSGTKMFILQDNMFEERDKPLRIVGEPDLVEHARQLVLELINESPAKGDFSKSKSEYGSGDVGGGRTYGGPGMETMKFPVPKVSVGLIIGKGGEMIKRIQVETGAKVQFDPVNSDMGDMDEQLAIITGKSDQIRLAQLKIEELVETALYGGKGGEGGGGGGPPRGSGGGSRGGWEGGGGGCFNKRGDGDEDRLVVPVTRVGMIIGKGGETIRMINQTSGAHCEIDRNLPQEGPERTFVIRGTRQQIQHAKELIQEKVNTFPSKGGQGGRGEYGGGDQGWGGGGGGSYGGGNDWNQSQSDPSKMQDATAAQWAAYYASYYQQPAAAAAAGGTQPDYTEQWIEYLRAQGQHEQADLLEQQAKAAKSLGGSDQNAAAPGSAATNPAGAAAANGNNVDYSQQWAEHYRSIGKIQEAEAIEAYIKTQKTGAPTPGTPQHQQQPSDSNKQQTPPYANYNYGAAGGGGGGGGYYQYGNGGGKSNLTPPGDS